MFKAVEIILYVYIVQLIYTLIDTCLYTHNICIDTCITCVADFSAFGSAALRGLGGYGRVLTLGVPCVGSFYGGSFCPGSV